MSQAIRLWWQNEAIYQVYPRSFQDSNGDGVGDLAGILLRVNYLADLGVRAVWVSPFYPSPMADFGYDVSNYCGVDPLFGTLDDFDHLLEAIHARGMKLILDLSRITLPVNIHGFSKAGARGKIRSAIGIFGAIQGLTGGLPTTGKAILGGLRGRSTRLQGSTTITPFCRNSLT